MARKRKAPAPFDDPLKVYGVDPKRGDQSGLWERNSTTPAGAVPQFVKDAVPKASVLPNPQLIKDPTTGKPLVNPGSTLPDGTHTALSKDEIDSAKVALATASATAGGVAEADTGKPWWQSLFDTSDTWVPNVDAQGNETGGVHFGGVDGPVSVVGGLWDSAFRALQWGTDRIAQATTAAMSAAPGGTRTWSWDEAGQISVGQQLLSDVAMSTGAARRGEASTADWAGLLMHAPLAGVALLAAQADPDTPLQREGFDPLSPEADQSFGQGWERFFSGGTDFAFAFADPTLALGWAGKAGRLRYIDQLIDSPQKMAKATAAVARDREVLMTNLAMKYTPEELASGARTIERDLGDVKDLKLAPQTAFLYEATRVGEDGKKLMSFSKLYNHKVIKYATNRDALAEALHNADSLDEASLIYRHAIGDASAAEELMVRRPGILSELIDGERELMRSTFAADPSKQAQMLKTFQARLDRLAVQLDETSRALVGKPELQSQLDDIRRARDEVLEDWTKAANGEIPMNAQQKAADLELAIARQTELMKRDARLQEALDQAKTPGGLYGSMTGSVKGFSSDTALGRAVERSRQRRAGIQADTESMRGMGLTGNPLWRSSDHAYMNGIVGRGKRALRVWRYLGAEAPSFSIHLSGISAQESAREVRALLNSVRMYGGKAKTITTYENGIPTVRQVGGQMRKEELLTRYVNSLNEANFDIMSGRFADGSVMQRQAAADSLAKIEEEIKREMADWYGVPKGDLDQVFGKVNQAREQLRSDIVNNHFWVDEHGVENKSPYLESQLVDSEIAPNWRAVEGKVIALGDNFAERMFDAGKGYGVEAYSAFQDVWRPMTLLRLGYTQRNVAEGLFRSTAFQFSLMPLVDTVRQGGISVSNVRRTLANGKHGQRGAMARVTDGVNRGLTIDQMPKRFQKWHAAQMKGVSDQQARNNQVIDFAYEHLATESKTWRDAEWARRNAQARTLIDEKNAIMRELLQPKPKLPNGMSITDAQMLVERNAQMIDGIYARLAILAKHRSSKVDDLTPELQRTADDVAYLTDSVEPLLATQSTMLGDMRSAAGFYHQQTLAKRRLWQGQGNVSDPETLRGVAEGYRGGGQAFDPNDSYANIALMNLSADHTTRQAMSMQMSTVERILTQQATKHNVAVNPGEPAYFEGMATVLNQWKQSDIGQRIINEVALGTPDDQIVAKLASFLTRDPRGRDIADWISLQSGRANGKLNGFQARGIREAKATQAAEAASKMERLLADQARDAYLKAQDDLSMAQQVAAAAGKKTLRVNGKIVRNPDAFLARHEAAWEKAEKAYEQAVLTRTGDVGLDGLAPSLSLEDAVDYAVEMVDRYHLLTARSPELQTYLAGAKTLANAGGEGPLEGLSRTIEGMIGAQARRGDGSKYSLIPIIGSETTNLGNRKFFDTMRQMSNKAFRVLGTVPEDTFVRAPFYGRRWQATYDNARRALIAQRGDTGLTLKDMNVLRDLAHRRALKDTKDWLYTIDRRTLLGQYGESVVPFVSAMQNSVTTVGRMIWNNPMVGAAMYLIWTGPQRAGIADEDGNFHFASVLEALPSAVRENAALDTMLDATFNLSQFDLLSPNPGGSLPIPTPGPVVVVPFNIMEQRGWLISPTAPDLLVSVLGKEGADEAWRTVNDYVYGSSAQYPTGMSSLPLAADKFLPAAQQKMLDILRGPGNSASFTSWYNKIYQTKMLQNAANGIDTMPDPDEVESEANWFQGLRIAANYIAFSPPGYTSEITPVLEAVHHIYDTEPDQAKADMKVYEMFGPIAPTLQQIAKITSSGNVAGLQANADNVRMIEQHADLISDVAPSLESLDDLDTLGILGSAQSDYAYDPSISSWMRVQKIPGTQRTFNEVRDPRQAAIDSQRSAGWGEYMRTKTALEAVAAQRGKKSLRSDPELTAQLKAKVASMANDPRFAGWYADFETSSGSSRTFSTVRVIESALANPKWRDDHEEDPIWQVGGAADQYVNARDRIVELLKASTDPDQKRALRAEWSDYRGQLGTLYPDWGTKMDRYLSGDDDPVDPGLVLGQEDVAVDAPTQQPEQQQPPGYENMGAPYGYGG